jgi:hypothetical protein
MLRLKEPIKLEILADYLGLNSTKKSVRDKKLHLNAISSSVVLYFIGNKACYEGLKERLIENILDKIKSKGKDYDYMKDAEFLIMALDLSCCPYLTEEHKKAILKAMNLEDTSIDRLLSFSKTNKYMFVKWSGVDINKELAAKNSQEVYS